MMEWQPIETAPKDGTQILGYSTACIECIYFDEDANLWVQSWEGDEDYGLLGAPVAWMPLPKPPAM